mgnify:CR=1 FL=1
MSQYYPPDDDQETRRRPDPAPRPRPVTGGIQATRPAQRPQSVDSAAEASPLYVPWWVFALVTLIVAGLTCGLWGVVLMTRGSASTANSPTPTPIFVVITATPTLAAQGGTPAPVTITPAFVLTSTGSSGLPTDIPNLGVGISMGSLIEVAGTEGFGLTVRQGPGKDYAYLFVALDGERFEVKDGPRQADEFIWWYIVDPDDPNRFGWAVSNFMAVVDQ